MRQDRHRIQARPPQGEVRRPRWLEEPSQLASFLEDAAHTPGGRARAVALPASEGEVAWVLRECAAVLPVGAQSSLTGGATPFGETVLSLSRMTAVGAITPEHVRVEPGVTLTALEPELARRGVLYPPASTYRGASLGGTVATNAAGASTFKYGTTRDWIRALTVVLAGGDVLDLERGLCRAHPDGFFEVVLAGGEAVRVPLPSYVLPRVPKRSAGYHAEPGMDLVDLFIGSEGTLGVVTSIELKLTPAVPVLFGWMVLDAEDAALGFAAALRAAALECRTRRDPNGLDVAAIESVDRRALELLREDGADRAQETSWPASARCGVLFQIELPAGSDAASVSRAFADAGDESAADSPVRRLATLTAEHGDLDRLEIVLPGEARRVAQLLALREAVPEAVNRRIAEAQRRHGAGVRKTAGDMIVPFERLPEMMARYRLALTRRGLDHAIWGHVSDGNLHVNVIPRDPEDTRAGEEALLELGAEAIRLGGCPLSEHGVGRNPVKQALLRLLVGAAGIGEIRRAKAALDPLGKLSPGVLLPAE